MRHNKKLIASLLALLLLIGLAACGGSGKSSMSYNSSSAASKPAYAGSGSYMVESEMAYDEGWYDSVEAPMESAAKAEEGRTSESSALNKPNTKLIYTANLEVQTTDFDETVDAITRLVDAHGGYFESSSIYNGGYYGDQGYYSGSYTVRVPSENYRAFMDAVGGSCYIVNKNENVQDVGLRYYEIESRLQTLYTKEARLQELLAEAAGMSDIIELENALSDTEYEIDMYKSEQNRYDSLIGYSTVYINVTKVRNPSGGVTEELSFGERVSRAFSEGTEDFILGLQDFAEWLAYNIFNLLLFLIIAAIIITIIVKLARRPRKPRAPREKKSRKKDKSGVLPKRAEDGTSENDNMAETPEGDQ